MAKLKLGPLVDDKPIRLTIELPAQVHRDLAAYAEVLGREGGQPVEPAKLVAPMLARFMATDRAFRRLKRSDTSALSRASDSAEQHRGDRREPGG
ncbi:DUF2274 domain-containing protein [Propylenella binzhouense]|uniref:DUF2274 domain-containing protein n=1 Tax=Propylenella binzhouense TaxID=2555902 RepID=A0A964T121_9HYPH|nr:DUF2274 domain-containing protein [Propylenella binzhouense]MYZ46269.1 DUF2274 domain-containing protein [Propylenella binzhouense]